VSLGATSKFIADAGGARGDFCEVARERKIVSLLGDLLPGNRETLTVGAGKHLLSRLDPGKGLVVLVPGIEESHDRLPERGSAFEHAVLNRAPAEQ